MVSRSAMKPMGLSGQWQMETDFWSLGSIVAAFHYWLLSNSLSVMIITVCDSGALSEGYLLRQKLEMADMSFTISPISSQLDAQKGNGRSTSAVAPIPGTTLWLWVVQQIADCFGRLRAGRARGWFWTWRPQRHSKFLKAVISVWRWSWTVRAEVGLMLGLRKSRWWARLLPPSTHACHLSLIANFRALPLALQVQYARCIIPPGLRTSKASSVIIHGPVVRPLVWYLGSPPHDTRRH